MLLSEAVLLLTVAAAVSDTAAAVSGAIAAVGGTIAAVRGAIAAVSGIAAFNFIYAVSLKYYYQSVTKEILQCFYIEDKFTEITVNCIC